MIAGVKVIRGGRYGCEFCTHKSWKQLASAVSHVQEYHPKDSEIAQLKRDLKKEQNKPPQLKIEEKVVYKEKPQPKYWSEPIAAFCGTCHVVMTGTKIPRGQTIENTPHSVCGTTALQLVKEIQ